MRDPEGVFQVATGDGSTGAALIEHVDCMMFTGSTKTGKAVAKAAADRLIPCYLELGGKDPMIVLADANLDRAANAAAFYSMNNGGQVCISVERVYVEEPVYDEFVQKVTDNVRKIRQGPPEGAGSVDVGAVTFPPQLEIVDGHVKDAVQKGAKVLVGGQSAPRRGTLLRADRAGRRRSLDADHDRGDVRPDAADHEGQGRRGGAAAGQRLRLRPRRRASGPRTSRRARRLRAASRPARCASTTRRSTTRR